MPRTRSVHPVPGALGHQRPGGHEQRRVVDAPGRHAGYPLRRPSPRPAAPAPVALSVSSHQRPPGRSTRHASRTAAGQVGYVLEDLTGAHHVRAAVRQRQGCHIPADHRTPCAAACAARSGPGPPRRGGSPCRPGAGRAAPPPQPRSTSTAPSRAAGGISRGPGRGRSSAAWRTHRPAATTRPASSSYCRGSLRTRTGGARQGA